MEGDFVLLLQPTDNNKLTMQWKGPFKVESVIGLNDYRINVKGKSKIYYVNLLKKYYCPYERAGSQGLELPAEVGCALLDMVSSAIIEDDESNNPEDVVDDNDLLDIIPTALLKWKKT